MLFSKLRINYFGRFHNKEIELKPGINLIYGDNEAGKSTVHTFIRGMLFGIERMRGRGSASKEDLYTRYLPWDYPGAYSGSMDLRIGDKDYRLQRSFHANDKDFTITDLITGREIKLKEGLISEMIPGLTESAFKNTISIEQLKAQTDTELAAQVRNYIANLSIAKSKEVDVDKAVSQLNNQRKQLEPSQNPATLKALQDDIDEGLSNEEKMDQLTLQLKDLLSKEQELKEQKETAESFGKREEFIRMEQLPEMKEKYRSYQEKSKQLDTMLQQEKELLEIISEDKEANSADSIKKDIEIAEQLRSGMIEADRLELELQREMEGYHKYTNRYLLMSILPAVAVAFIIMILSDFHIPGILAAVAIVVIGAVIYIAQNKRNQNKKHDNDKEVSELAKHKNEIQTKTDSILMKYQISRLEDLTAKQAEVLSKHFKLDNAKKNLEDLHKRIGDLEDSRDSLYEIIMKYMQYFIQEEELSASSMLRLEEVIGKKKLGYLDQLKEKTNQYNACFLKTRILKSDIAKMEGNEGELLKNQERYRTLSQEQKVNAVELEAIKLALTTIQDLSADIHDTFGQQLNKAVSEVIGEVTGGRYHDLKIDEKLEVSVGWNDKYYPLDRLSAGTIDQVYFALRLAVADLLLGSDEVPLLLDDSFALYDESRVKAALSRIAQRKQIILFTCHKREQTILEGLGLPYHIVDLTI